MGLALLVIVSGILHRKRRRETRATRSEPYPFDRSVAERMNVLSRSISNTWGKGNKREPNTAAARLHDRALTLAKLQGLEPRMPSHSETISALTVEASSVRGADRNTEDLEHRLEELRAQLSRMFKGQQQMILNELHQAPASR